MFLAAVGLVSGMVNLALSEFLYESSVADSPGVFTATWLVELLGAKVGILLIGLGVLLDNAPHPSMPFPPTTPPPGFGYPGSTPPVRKG